MSFSAALFDLSISDRETCDNVRETWLVSDWFVKNKEEHKERKKENEATTEIAGIDKVPGNALPPEKPLPGNNMPDNNAMPGNAGQQADNNVRHFLRPSPWAENCTAGLHKRCSFIMRNIM